MRRVFLFALALSSTAQASTSLLVSGHAGFVGQIASDIPPFQSLYTAFRVPVGMVLEARPTDRFSLYLGFDYAYNNFPGPSVLLGQTTGTASGSPASSSSGTQTPLPFSNTTDGSLPYSQKVDVPALTQAYLAYATDFGVFQAGRMPQHWGLGIWKNAVWTPYGGLPSTSDAVSFTTSLSAFNVTASLEKYGEGVGGTSKNGSATAYTIAAVLRADPADPPSSGLSREFGLTLSKFVHAQSNTSLQILDAYSKIYFPRFFIGAEFLYPSGETQSPNYQSLGGAAACSSSPEDVNPGSQTCLKENVSAIAALLKLKYQIDNSDSNGSLAATEKAQELLGTAERTRTQTVGFWLGYASGSRNQFAPQNISSGGRDISAIFMNPSVQPAFLMFNNTMPAVSGMPGGALTNTTFTRIDYTFETPAWGSVGPAFTWAVLNHTNPLYGSADNPLCNNEAVTSVNPNTPLNTLCVGGNRSLGQELDVSYRYTTLDRVTFGVDAGYWFVGRAWQVFGQKAPSGNYGGRASVSTQF